jgi:glutathione synthase/RimK-type ligase-like ATP-grasp enzyme
MKVVMPTEVPASATHIIRWGTTTNLPESAKKRTIFNKASAIHQTSDKATFRKLMSDHGLAPKTWLTLADLQKEEEVANAVIVRPRNHERSEGIHLCSNLAQLKTATSKVKDYYISEYIPKTNEYRAFVVQGKIIMLWEKQPKNKNDVSWGCVEEGSFKYIAWSKWPLKVAEVAVKAFNLSTLDFGAVDIIYKDNKAYALEINTAPEVWPYYGERFAAAFKYMIEKGHDRLKTAKFGDWKDMAHPSLS